MRRSIAVIGNAAHNIGFVTAADLALAGQDVRLADWPDSTQSLQAIKHAGGLQVEGEAERLTSGRTGFAPLRLVTDALGEAVRGADIVWLVSFMKYDLGFFDHEKKKIEPIPDPFDEKVLPMCRE